MLGGMRIDLWKLGLIVKSLGGFNKVTMDRAWKRVADYFEFPPTCTNAAFVLKRVYMQALKDFVGGSSRSGSPMSMLGKPHEEDTSSDEEIKKLYLNAASGRKSTGI